MAKGARTTVLGGEEEAGDRAVVSGVPCRWGDLYNHPSKCTQLKMQTEQTVLDEKKNASSLF